MAAFVFLLMFFGASIGAFAYTGAGGSWGDDSGFGGNGGGFGGSGSGGDWGQSCSANIKYSGVPTTSYPSPSAACASLVGQRVSNYIFTAGSYMGGDKCYYAVKFDNGVNADFPKGASMLQTSNCLDEPKCPAGEVIINGVCTKELKCPAGYVKQDNKCIWQCPAGYKMLGGNCVKDDMPEDCDPMTQTCDENGEPVCDCCGSLAELVNLTNTQINNDNRVISLTETMVTNQNITNNNINNVNNTLNTINETINNVITAIENSKPDFDTTAIEAKLDEVITAIQNNNGVGEDGQPIDLTEILRLLNEINQGVKDNKFDDTQLNAYFDEIINKGIPVGVDFTPVTDRQDEQTSLLDDIKNILMIQKDANGDPALDLEQIEATPHNPWGALTGFDISQNRINASKQCPADKHFSVMGADFSIPMSPMCNYLAYLAPVFLMLAYFQGAMIILRSGD